MERPINTIAREIREDWSTKGKGVSPYASPYLDAMECLTTINEMYYHDTAKSVVLYFLSNASGWRGETAKRIKAELKGMAS